MKYLHIDPPALDAADRRYRANLINCLSGFKSTHLIGTLSPEGYTNLALFHNVVHLGADPALIGFVNRPRESSPHTLANIERTGVYTMNTVHTGMIRAAHQTSARYPESVSEFEATGVSALFRKGIPAPFVLESAIQYAMRLVEVVPIRHNGTFLVIGKLMGAWIREDILAEDGFLHVEKAQTVTTLGLDGYYEPVLLERLPYARASDPSKS